MFRLSFLAFALGLVACVGDSPVQPGTDAGPDVVQPSTDGGGDAQADAADAACTADTQNDPKNCGACGHDCNAGACTAGKCQPYTVATGQQFVYSVGASATRVFWTRYPNGLSGGGVFSAALDGTDIQNPYPRATNYGCTGLAVTQTEVVFMCDDGLGGHEIRACDLPACAATHVVRGPLGTNASQIGADFATSRTFFSIYTPYNSQTGGTILDDTGAQVGSSNQPSPGQIVVDTGYVYWLNSGTYTSDNPDKNGGVRRASLSNIATEQVVSTAKSQYYDCGGLAVDAFNVYFTGGNFFGTGRDVLVAPKNGTGNASVFAQNTGSGAVASDGKNVYFDSTSAILYCPRASGCGTTPSTFVNEGAVSTSLTIAGGALVYARGDVVRRVVLP